MFDAAPGLKRTFAWNPAWAIRFESLWSLSNKFALLNVVSVADVTETINADREGKPGPLKSRRIDKLTDDEIGRFLGLPAERVAEGRPELLFVKRDRPWLFPKDTLRYCPECLVAGYHSSLHQPHCVKTCPVHGTPIEDACPSCNKPLPLTPTGLSRAEPYACPSCGHKLWKPYLTGFHGSYRNVLKLGNEDLQELQSLHDWFVQACSAIVCRTDIPRWLEISNTKLHSSLDSKMDMAITGQASQHWGDALNMRVPKALGSKSARVIRSGKVGFNSRQPGAQPGQPIGGLCLDPIEDPDPKAWDSPITRSCATRIYKAVRRHLRHEFLQRHRACSDMVEQALWREPDGSERHSICPWAFTYLFWRQLWERQLHFSTPRAVFRIDRAVGQVAGSHQLPVDFLGWASSKSLVLELLFSFEECALLAKAMEAHKSYSWDEHRFHARYYPYWTITQESDGQFCWSTWSHILRPSRHLRKPPTWRAHLRQTQAQVMELRCDI